MCPVAGAAQHADLPFMQLFELIGGIHGTVSHGTAVWMRFYPPA
jgi:hypothetical protein